MRTFPVEWLANKPEAWRVEAVEKSRVRLDDYEAMDRRERCFYIAVGQATGRVPVIASTSAIQTERFLAMRKRWLRIRTTV